MSPPLATRAGGSLGSVSAPDDAGSGAALPAYSESGLSTHEVARRLAEDGPNLMPSPARPSPWRMLVRQLTHLLALLLWAGAVLALVAGMPALTVAIVVIVLLNAAFAFWQEHRADRSTEELRALLPATTRVVRGGTPATVDVSDLVVGDLVMLAAGDRVGADMRIDRGDRLGMDESLVTGESEAVSREPGDVVMSGTFVVAGEATATVVATGTRTTLASITALTASADRPSSPLTVQLNRVVQVVAVIATLTGILLGSAALLLGLSFTEAFLFGVGVSVALVPEGLLPTVTLSLARGARMMAEQQALVRRLDAVETLGETTFICSDKTGTLTQNRMSVVAAVTPVGTVHVSGHGYDPVASFVGSSGARASASVMATHALACVTGRVVHHDTWVADGDPLEAAIHSFSLRLGCAAGAVQMRRPYSAERMLSSALWESRVSVLGAPEAVLDRCTCVPSFVHGAIDELTDTGRRVLAVAHRRWDGAPDEAMEHDLELLGLLAVQDPPRREAAAALRSCHAADIRVAMLTGDHPRTARAIAREVGLLGDAGVVLDGRSLPTDDAELARLLDSSDGAVVARVSPEGKLRVARALRGRGHVVAMTGDGVNDAPALREADVGVAMGASGSDVARESADLVLLDDDFATIVAAIEQGRATFQNVRRFLTYHLTDNVAELAPFAVWALSGGQFPLALGVLQILCLDIGTDMLPALALGAEPPRSGIMTGRRRRRLLDRALLARSFLVLGLTEALMALAAFTVVLVSGGWTWGTTPSTGLAAAASGAAFATIAVGQMVNAFACRSTTRPVWRLDLRGNPLVLVAIAAELALLMVFLGVPPLARLLGGTWPPLSGWSVALAAGAAVALVDGLVKLVRSSHRRS